MKTYDARTQEVLARVEHKKKTHRAVVVAVTTSACCILVLVMSLVLFLPYGTPQGGPYQSVVNAVYRAQYRNNWQAWTDSLSHLNTKTMDYSTENANMAPEKGAYMEMDGFARLDESMAAPNGAVRENSAAKADAYVENTNLQVMGVREGDVLKESTHYFYRLRSRESVPQDEWQDGPYDPYRRNIWRLDVYRKAGLDTALVGTLTYASAEDWWIYDCEMYLNDACDRLTIVCGGSSTGLVTVDVTDPTAPRVSGEYRVAGQYRTSRVVDGRLLLITDWWVGDVEDYSDYASYVPYVRKEEDVALIRPEDILCPDKVQSLRYAVITHFDADMTCLGQVALLGYSADVVYANTQRVYVASLDVWYDEDRTSDVTDVACVAYDGQGARLMGQIAINGIIENQYWMDEYEGVLRVAANVNVTEQDGQRVVVARWWGGNNASLYCYRVSDWQSVATVECFAPEGETVQSVRFVGTKAYVCTAEIVRFTDPVYCFDLSDYAHITATSTGAIDGYSTSLVPFTDGTLLGIGVEDGASLKVELYRETEDAVTSVASYTLGGVGVGVDCYPLLAYKSFLLDAEHGLIGVCCSVWHDRNSQYEGPTYEYALFTYRQGELRLVQEVALDEEILTSSARAVARDGFVYLFGETSLRVVVMP